MTDSIQESEEWRILMHKISKQSDLPEKYFGFLENKLLVTVQELKTGGYDLNLVKAGSSRHEIELSKWREARIYLKLAALTQGLEESHYYSLQPMEPGTGNAFTGENKYTGFEKYYRADKLRGKRGGASNKEGALRGMAIKLIAEQLPMDRLREPYAIVARLVRLAGIECSNQNCRGILLKGKT